MLKLPESKRWADLSNGQRIAIILIGMTQITLLISALVDLRRRPASEINGDKRLWTLISFINFVGPLSYFLFGRKRH